MTASGLIDEVNKNRRMYYKHQFLLLTNEFYYRFVVPSPLSIIVQLFALFRKDLWENPFGTICRLIPSSRQQAELRWLSGGYEETYFYYFIYYKL